MAASISWASRWLKARISRSAADSCSSMRLNPCDSRPTSSVGAAGHPALEVALLHVAHGPRQHVEAPHHHPVDEEAHQQHQRHQLHRAQGDRPALRLAQHRLDRGQVPVQQQGRLPGPLQVDRLLQLVGVGPGLQRG